MQAAQEIGFTAFGWRGSKYHDGSLSELQTKSEIWKLILLFKPNFITLFNYLESCSFFTVAVFATYCWSL